MESQHDERSGKTGAGVLNEHYNPSEEQMIDPTAVMPIVNDEISLTEKAVAQVRRLMEAEKIPAGNGLRISVKGGGCSGLSYVMGFDAEPRETDKVLEMLGLRIFVDPKSLFYISGTVLDYSDGLNGKGFVFQNPKAAKTCGCGSSFGV
jgi:iron-sulfur cluster assembly protein